MPLEDQKSELEAIARVYAARVTRALEALSWDELCDLLREIDEILSDNNSETN
jgi:hypothetical protein